LHRGFALLAPQSSGTPPAMTRETNAMGRRAVLAGLTWALVAQAPAFAQSRRVLSDADRADVARVEAYLEAVRTLEARFLQIAPDGSTAEGMFWLSRPGRLRLEYDLPNPNLLIADGRAFVHIDRYLRTIAYLPLDSTPAGVLVRAQVRLAGDVEVVGIDRGPGVLRISVVQVADPRAGRLTLIFAERPFALSSWQVVDGQGLTTRITLLDPRVGIAIDPERFRIVDPSPANRDTNR
jgi:outer membrane lipoprotein-sorting protein